MKAYEIPADTACMTPAQAQGEINRMLAAWRADPEHPGYCGNHPQHAEYQAHLTALYTIVAEGRAAQKEAEFDAALEADGVCDLEPAAAKKRMDVLIAERGAEHGMRWHDPAKFEKLCVEIRRCARIVAEAEQAEQDAAAAAEEGEGDDDDELL